MQVYKGLEHWHILVVGRRVPKAFWCQATMYKYLARRAIFLGNRCPSDSFWQRSKLCSTEKKTHGKLPFRRKLQRIYIQEWGERCLPGRRNNVSKARNQQKLEWLKFKSKVQRAAVEVASWSESRTFRVLNDSLNFILKEIRTFPKFSPFSCLSCSCLFLTLLSNCDNPPEG